MEPSIASGSFSLTPLQVKMMMRNLDHDISRVGHEVL